MSHYCKSKLTKSLFLFDICWRGCTQGNMCSLLSASCRTQLFKSLKDYPENNWPFCVCICTVSAVTGLLSDFTTQFKEISSECEIMLISWKMSPGRNILQDVFKIVSHITIPALTSHLFLQLLKDNTEHTHPLLYTEVRWFPKTDHWPEFLSYESHSRNFLYKKSPPAAHFIDPEWVANLACHDI